MRDIKNAKLDEYSKAWIRGIAFSMYYLIEIRDEPGFAFELAREAGISKTDLTTAGVDTLEKKAIYSAMRKEGIKQIMS
jgi:hypothetical protein